MIERTLSIIKPDAVKARHAGEILARFEKAGFSIVALRMRHLSRPEAEGFYHVHRERPFFGSLCAFMSSAPCLTMVLERENAIAHLRDLMGATDPAKAAPGTIRKDFATSIEANCVHGSDAPDTARFEVAYFFPGIDRVREGGRPWGGGGDRPPRRSGRAAPRRCSRRCFATSTSSEGPASSTSRGAETGSASSSSRGTSPTEPAPSRSAASES